MLTLLQLGYPWFIGNAVKGQTEGSLHVAMRHIMAHSPVFRAVKC